MKLKTIDMIEKGEDRKEGENKLCNEYKISVKESTLSDWWVGRDMRIVQITCSYPFLA